MGSPKYVVIDCSIPSHEELHDTFNTDTSAEAFLKKNKGSDFVLYTRADSEDLSKYEAENMKLEKYIKRLEDELERAKYDPSDRYGSLES